MRRYMTLVTGIGLALAACGGGQTDGGDDATSEPSPVSTTTTTSEPPPASTTTTQGPAQASGEPAIFAITFDGTGCLYDGPEIVTAGLAEAQFVNPTDVSVAFQIWRLDEGVLYDQFKEVSSASAPDDIADTMAILPGPSADPGPLTHESVFDLAEGRHALMCLLFEGDGPPSEVLHVRVLDTMGSSPGVVADEVVEAAGSAGSVVKYDGSTCTYEGTETLAAGTIAVVFVNSTDADVGLHLAHLNEGVSYEEFKTQIESGPTDDIAPVAAWMITPQDNPGPASQLRTLDVVAGTYALTCVSFDEPGPPIIIHVRSIDAS